MASVTFPKDLGGDGNTYTDDADPNTGLDGLGYTVRFIPALNQGMLMAKSAKDSAAAAFASQGAAKKSADASDTSAKASQKAQQDSEKLYGSLQAVDTARADAQQAATTAGQQRTSAETARKGAESAQSAAETAAGQSQKVAGQALKSHEDKDDPHKQYAKKGGFGVGSHGAGDEDGDMYLDGSRPLGEQANGLRAIRSGYTPPDVPDRVNSTWASVLLNKRTPTVGAGLLHSIPNDVYAFRVLNGVVSNIAKLFSETNAVGAIELIDGIASGAILERDSNDDGDWIKFLDGTMICFNFGFERVVSASNTDSLPNGWTRYGLGGGSQIFFPQPFIESPVMSFMNRNPSVGSRYLYGVQVDIGVTISGTEARPQIIFPHGRVDNVPVFLSYLAIGRWY